MPFEFVGAFGGTDLVALWTAAAVLGTAIDAGAVRRVGLRCLPLDAQASSLGQAANVLIPDLLHVCSCLGCKTEFECD